MDVSAFQIGEDIQLRSAGGEHCKNSINDENVVIAEVLGKVFKDRNGNYIEQTVSNLQWNTVSLFLYANVFFSCVLVAVQPRAVFLCSSTTHHIPGRI